MAARECAGASIGQCRRTEGGHCAATVLDCVRPSPLHARGCAHTAARALDVYARSQQRRECLVHQFESTELRSLGELNLVCGGYRCLMTSVVISSRTKARYVQYSLNSTAIDS